MANENEGPNAPYATPSWRPVASRQCQSAPRIGAGSTGSVGTTVAGRTRRGNLFSPLSTTGFSAAPAPTWQSLAMGLQPTPPRASLTASASPLAAEPHVAIRRSDELRQQSDALIVDLRSMMEDTQTSDIVIVLDSGEELTAHRAILAARSDVFRWVLWISPCVRALCKLPKGHSCSLTTSLFPPVQHYARFLRLSRVLGII
eukprot:scaffold143036_cov35-Tisochrysis_lutea.AAC.3